MSTQPQEIERRRKVSSLHAALQDIADLLRASDSIFADTKVTVQTEDDGDIDTLIGESLGRMGLCATIMMGKAGNVPKNLSSPIFRDLAIVVEICENAVLNRSAGTMVTALEAAEVASEILHHAALASGRMLLVTSLEKYAQPPAPADNCYHLVLTTSCVAFAAQ
jgi:hypothetical protein